MITYSINLTIFTDTDEIITQEKMIRGDELVDFIDHIKSWELNRNCVCRMEIIDHHRMTSLTR